MKKLRTLHPITQQQLADYLLISRDQVAHYERRRRNLPHNAQLKLGKLVIAMARNNHTLSTFAELKFRELQEKELASLQAELRQLETSLAVLTQKVKETGQKYDKAMQVLWAIPVLRTQLSAGKEGAFDKKWLQIVETDIMKQMKQIGPASQLRMQLRQTCLREQIKTIQLLLKDFSTTGQSQKNNKKRTGTTAPVTVRK